MAFFPPRHGMENDKYYREGAKFICFAGTSNPLSNWHSISFTVDIGDGVYRKYSSSEQALIYGKVVFACRDSEIAKQILDTNDVKKIKDLGQKATKFNEQKWDKIKYDLMVNILIAKFAQNANIRNILLATDDKVLIENAPWDSIWGIGNSPNATEDPKTWNGTNLLGYSLMETRKFLLPYHTV